MDKRFLEKFLRLNHVDKETASDEEIRDVLEKAKWSEEEVRMSIELIRNKGAASETQFATSGHDTSLFRPDMDWSSERLSSLLGVNVVVRPGSRMGEPSFKDNFAEAGRNTLLVATVTLFSVAIAVGAGIALMYHLQVGPFYIPLEESL